MVAGRLVTGATSNAAEVGHLSLDPEGLPCACGQRGCAETVASGPGLVTAARQILESSPALGSRVEAVGLGLRLKAGDTLSAAHILAAAQDGDPNALAALEAVGRALGIVAAACVALLNPDRIVIGGGLGVAAFRFLEKTVRAELALRTLPASHSKLALLPSELKSPAVGAACLVWYGSRRRAVEGPSTNEENE
jgi:glucokinase